MARSRDDLAELAGRVHLVVLAVKPNALDDVAAELAGAAPEAVLSMLAATPLRADRGRVSRTSRALRLMPNQPVEVRRGVLCYSSAAGMPDDVGAELARLLGLLGTAMELPEEQIDAAMAVMSCSPAYVALVAESAHRRRHPRGPRRPRARGLSSRETLAGTGEHLPSATPIDPPVRRAARGRHRGRARRARAPRARRRRSTPAVDASLERFGERPVAAIDRGDIADYVAALFLVYIILIFARIVLSWSVPRMPYNRALRAVIGFIDESRTPT